MKRCNRLREFQAHIALQAVDDRDRDGSMGRLVAFFSRRTETYRVSLLAQPEPSVQESYLARFYSLLALTLWAMAR